MTHTATHPSAPAPSPHLEEWNNPIGTDGFEFVEFSAEDPQLLDDVFTRLGFAKVARHRRKQAWLYRQGDINFIVNAEPTGHPARFRSEHGPSAIAMAFRVHDARKAYALLLERGAKPAAIDVGPMELNIPAIEGIGGALIYLVERGPVSIYDVDFEWLAGAPHEVPGAGLVALDHLTHNVYRGRMDYWAEFYERLFNFREIRYFDIEGKLTGLKSRALTSPCGKLRIPINESADSQSQIEEYLIAYRGEGIQHIALATDDICPSVDRLRELGMQFMSAPPESYYEMVEERLPHHGQDLAALRQRGILLDGTPDGRILLQIFTETCIAPIFFEIISRKGDEGFGEGNFRALFESMERDQIRRGVLQDNT
jgi:4-hydroxyphenylpyruvate dioxygenase